MRRKSMLLALGLFVFLAGGAAGTLVMLVRHEPAFYQKAAIPEGAYRERQAKECWRKLNDLYNAVTNADLIELARKILSEDRVSTTAIGPIS